MGFQSPNSGEGRRWDAYWAGVGSGEWLAAKALIELSPALLGSASSWLSAATDDEGPGHWVRWVEETGTGWSSTESRLFTVVAALLDPYPEDGVRREIALVSVVDQLGSWEGEVWRILTEWGTGGNNRDVPGRFTAVAQ